MSQTVLLTGASGGLGQSIAKGLAENGFSLALHFHQKKEKSFDKLISELKEINATFFIYQADFRNESEIVSLINSAQKDLGNIDVVINNAGVSHSAISWKQKSAEWQQVMDVNLTAPFLIMRETLPAMRKNNFGRIINISSVVAHKPHAGTSAYAAAKAGLEGLTRVIAIETAKNNITANAIALGFFDKGMINELDEALQKEIIKTIPAEKLGSADELLQCILYLCSKKTSYITGQTIHLNGGMYF